MKIQTVLKDTYTISAVHCTPDEMAKLLNDLGAPDFYNGMYRIYNGTVKIYQECHYDCDGYPTPTGLYTVVFTKTSASFDDKPDKVINEFDPYILTAFGINKND